MPQKEEMYWVPAQKRWTRTFKGKTYSVSARQLKCEPLKDASRHAANEWWRKKQAEIEKALGEAKRHPAQVLREYESAQENHRIYAKWQRKYGEIELAEKSDLFIEWLRSSLQSDNPAYPLTGWQKDPLWEQMQTEAGFFLWNERLRQIQREELAEHSVPRDNTIRAHLDDYMNVRRAQAVAKGKLGSYDTFKSRLNVFRSWLDPYAPIEDLNELLWERFCVYLAEQVAEGKMAPATMAGTQGAARCFIRSRWERRLIDLPRNLNNRTLSASVPLKEIIVFTVDEIKQLLEAASERKRLYLLLALNCGMYPVDIAKLRHDEVDWKEGRISRKRSKTRHRSENVPKVDYLLWWETSDLLKKYRSDDPELVLLNKNGTPLWVEAEKNGKFNRNNNIRTAYFQLQQQIEIPKDQRKPLKSLRKTPASMLENHPEYGRYAEYFLGEAPSSVAGRHYVKPSREQFDAAIRWLGEQLAIKVNPPSNRRRTIRKG